VTSSDLIEHKEMLHGIVDAFTALYLLNDKDTQERNLNKTLFYIERVSEVSCCGKIN